MGIRPLGIADYDQVMDLWRRSELSSLRPVGRDSREEFARQLQSVASADDAKGFQMALGLHKDDLLIGVIIVTHDGRKGWLNRLAVDPHHRRQGYARQLIAAAEKVLDAQDIRVIGALVERDNRESLTLFQRAGYTLHNDICYLSKRDSADA